MFVTGQLTAADRPGPSPGTIGVCLGRQLRGWRKLRKLRTTAASLVRAARLVVAGEEQGPPSGQSPVTGVGQEAPGCAGVKLMLTAHGVVRPLVACARGGVRSAGRLTPGGALVSVLVETTVDLGFDFLALRRGQLSSGQFQRRVVASALAAVTCAALTVALGSLVAGGSPGFALLMLVMIPLVAGHTSRRLVAVIATA
jgi:hypothetical protein